MAIPVLLAGAPLINCFYVGALGKVVGSEVLGESGMIRRNGVRVDHKNLTRFEHILAESGSWPLMIMPPIGVITYGQAIKATGYVFVHHSDMKKLTN